MPIVVTGAGGFVGRVLVERLLAEGHEVVGVDVHASLPGHDRLRVVSGDFAAAAVRHDALADGVDALVHLATVPGGAAEADPAASRRINIDAMYDLLDEVAARGRMPRVVYASSIAVFGDPLPAAGVDDTTPIAPRLIYGAHKAMMEIALSTASRRGDIDGITVRLPGILARPKGPSGMKSAFMSDLFHALRAGEAFRCPVSPTATIWAQSVTQCVANIIHGLRVDAVLLPSTRTVTLPALRITMADLADEVARRCGKSAALVSYHPDAALEAAFGAHPPLATEAAERAGFASDGTPSNLVERALARIKVDERT